MKQIMTGVKMYTSDYDEQSPQYWYNVDFPSAGVFGTWMEMINPYVKNTDLFMCPSAPKDAQGYSPGQCVGTTTKSTYCFPAWIYYNYWQWFGNPGTVMFAGFSSGITPFRPPATGKTLCTASYQACRGVEFAENPANAAWLIEGYVNTYWPTAGTQFGSACITGVSGDDTGTERRYWRHNEGMNLAFCDGHMKWAKAQQFYKDNSSKTGAGNPFPGYPRSAYMQMGP